MPNHVYQYLVVTCGLSIETLNLIKRRTCFENQAISCNAFFPMPEELKGTLVGTNEILSEEDYALYMADTKKVEEHKRNGWGLPITEAKAKEFTAKYGAKNWYEWALANWGTKWGIYDADQYWTEDSNLNNPSLSIRFQSAWSPAEKIIARLSEMFPQASFILSYVDEGWIFAGYSEIKAGQIISQTSITCDKNNPKFRELCDLVGYEIYEDDEVDC